MTQEVQAALITGLVLAVLYLGCRTFRYRGVGWPIADLLEAIMLALAPLPLPGSVKMITRALGREPLPTFDAVEDRLALGFGGGLLACAIAYAIVFGLMRGIRPRE